MPDLHLIFNHRLTPAQKEAAAAQLGIRHIHPLPENLQAIWSQIPPDLPKLADYLEPVVKWLSDTASPMDYVLIQGDFGACCRMVAEAFRLELIPIYSTTRREAVEEHQADGTVALTHRFRHVTFRNYE